MSKHCVVINTTVHARHGSIRRRIADGFDCARGLPELRANDKFGVGRSSGSTSDSGNSSDTGASLS